MAVKFTRRKTAQSSEEDISWIERLDQNIDDLTKNRLSTRETALENIIKLVSQNNAILPLEPRTEEFVDALVKSIDLGESEEETILAIQAINFAFINHGDAYVKREREALYQEVAFTLRQKAKKSKNLIIKAQCYETLSLLTYMVSSEIDAQIIRQDMHNIMMASEEHDDENSDILLTAVINAYALMFITSYCNSPTNLEIIQEEIDRVLGELEYLIETPGNVQMATGQTIALFFEVLRSVSENVDDQQNEMNELIHTLKSLSMDQDEEDEYVFQDILNTIEDGIQPYYEVEFKGKSFTLDKWSKIIPLKAFQRQLGKGINQYYKSNDTIWLLLADDVDDKSDSEVSVEEASLASMVKYSNISKVDKRAVYEESKKSRTKHMKSARSGKEKQY
ncbi:unnamed protein product [Cunninghamella blakesleeana]